MIEKQITSLRAIIIFTGATLYFFLLLFTLFPYIKSHFVMNPILYWFITGYFLFIPLFVLAIIFVKHEGNKSLGEIVSALNIKPFSKRDWIYSIKTAR